MLALVVACKKGGEAGEGAAGEATAKPVVGVRTAVATAQPFTETVDAIGDVEARAGHVAALSAPAPTRVSRVLVTTGQHVSSGQELVQLEATALRASTQSAEAALTAAEQSYERAQRLATEGIVPRKEAETAAAELAKARADVVTTRRSEQLTVLRSPIGGVVTRMTARMGSMADPTQPLVEVADPSTLDIILDVTPSDAGRVRPGATVNLSAGQNAAGEPLGVGRVVDISGTVDSTSRSVEVRVQAGATKRPLRIGETVFGRISVATHAAAITVPVEALVPEGEGFKVWVVDAGGIAHARPVTVGAKTSATAQITSGLTGGERVVTYGAYGVEDSAKVVQAKP